MLGGYRWSFPYFHHLPPLPPLTRSPSYRISPPKQQPTALSRPMHLPPPISCFLSRCDCLMFYVPRFASRKRLVKHKVRKGLSKHDGNGAVDGFFPQFAQQQQQLEHTRPVCPDPPPRNCRTREMVGVFPSCLSTMVWGHHPACRDGGWNGPTGDLSPGRSNRDIFPHCLRFVGVAEDARKANGSATASGPMARGEGGLLLRRSAPHHHPSAIHKGRKAFSHWKNGRKKRQKRPYFGLKKKQIDFLEPSPIYQSAEKCDPICEEGPCPRPRASCRRSRRSSAPAPGRAPPASVSPR